MPRSAIYDIKTLDAEIKRLKKKADDLEDQFNDSADELKGNYGKMAFNSFVGNRIRDIPLIGTLLYPWVADPAVQQAIQQVAENVAKKISAVLQKWAAAVFNK